ncbi:MAG: hypothetical protein RLZZ116_1429 [Planctomycetota bacterium]
MSALFTALLGMSMPELSLIFFMTLFVVLVLRLVFSRSDRWQKDARIPLDEQGNGGSNNARH